jgi:hypothetical protein
MNKAAVVGWQGRLEAGYSLSDGVALEAVAGYQVPSVTTVVGNGYH